MQKEFQRRPCNHIPSENANQKCDIVPCDLEQDSTMPNCVAVNPHLYDKIENGR